MPKLRRSAAYRLAFGYTAFSALAVLVMGAGVYYAAGAALRHDLDRTITGEVSALKREYDEGGVPDLMDAIVKHDRRPGNGFRYALFDPKGIARLNELSLPRAALGWGDMQVPEPGRQDLHARFRATRLAGGETLLVASDTRHLDRLGTSLLTLLSAGFLTMLGLGAAGAIIFGRLLQRRLEGISSTAEAIVAGDLTRRVMVGRSGDEFDRAGASLNLMLDRIAQLVENLHQVSSDVAHDLRTPLQRLRGAVEAGLNGPKEVRSLIGALRTAQEQSDAILGLFAAILRISEVEAGRARERFEEIDLATLITNVCEMYAPAIEDGGRTLICSCESPVLIFGDRELSVQMVTNLLDNSALHTPAGTIIRVSVQRTAAEAQLIVADTGPGVPEGDRERIVQRFVRLDAGRTTSGNGLGLNLVAAIASAHDGWAILDNHPGLCARVALPLRVDPVNGGVAESTAKNLAGTA